MKQVIVFPRGQLSAKDKERLSKGGLLAVEADDPSKVVCVVPGVPFVSGNDLLCAALASMTSNENTYVNREFVKGLTKRVLAKETGSPFDAQHRQEKP